MPTVTRLEPTGPNTEAIADAERVLLAGGLVGLPTETVYGLAADALNPEAIAKIFAAKQRPADNPLICHIADPAELGGLAEAVPASVGPLMSAFWPGPLTLILPARASVPAAITAGTGRVAVRLPAHPVARAVIRAVQRPLAAPSANRSGRPSCTTAQHIVDDLGDAVELILDAGPSLLGVESTVLDLSGPEPVLAREGGIPVGAIEALVGPICRRTRVVADEAPVSPGQKYRHYAPSVPLLLALGTPSERVAKIKAAATRFRLEGKQVAVLCLEGTARHLVEAGSLFIMGSEATPDAIAASLFRLLRDAERAGAAVILAESIPEAGIGAAAADRLRRASTDLL